MCRKRDAAKALFGLAFGVRDEFERRSAALFPVVVPSPLGEAERFGAIGVGAVPSEFFAVALIRLSPQRDARLFA